MRLKRGRARKEPKSEDSLAQVQIPRCLIWSPWALVSWSVEWDALQLGQQEGSGRSISPRGCCWETTEASICPEGQQVRSTEVAHQATLSGQVEVIPSASLLLSAASPCLCPLLSPRQGVETMRVLRDRLMIHLVNIH